MGKTNKADKLDATGFAVLLRNGTLPEVWIPPGDLRDQQELRRVRIFRVRLCPQVKNRIRATLARHNVSHTTDLFSVGARSQLAPRLAELPVYSREVVQQKLACWIGWTGR